MDKSSDGRGYALRVVPASELHEVTKAEAACPDETIDGGDGVEYEVVNSEGQVVMRTNQHIVDEASNQRMSAEEIEALKQGESSSGRDVIARLLESHSALDKKTSFALAKYTLRKTKKYMKRFTVLPLDVTLLANWLLYDKKDVSRTMEIREELLALACSWSNVHAPSAGPTDKVLGCTTSNGSNRWLVVDETGGLIIAAMAERMGLLYPNRSSNQELKTLTNGMKSETSASAQGNEIDHHNQANQTESSSPTTSVSKPHSSIFIQETAMSATSNSITLIHPNPQPNISLLSYFGYNANNPDPLHPLHRNLRTLSWLQVLYPEEDAAYREPEVVSDAELASMKGSKKGAYYRKRRRWQRTRSVVDETRAGDFEGLIVASFMSPETILHHVVPLLKGGSQVVIYSPTIEPLMKLADCYSKLRRLAFVNSEAPEIPSEEFSVNPLLLLAPTIYTARARPWQVLPGRTHPKMMGRGGSEGYVFVATRVLPLGDKVEARGKFTRKRKATDLGSNTSSKSESEKMYEDQPSKLEDEEKVE